MTIETAQAVWKGWRLATASPAPDFVPNLGRTIFLVVGSNPAGSSYELYKKTIIRDYSCWIFV